MGVNIPAYIYIYQAIVFLQPNRLLMPLFTAGVAACSGKFQLKKQPPTLHSFIYVSNLFSSMFQVLCTCIFYEVFFSTTFVSILYNNTMLLLLVCALVKHYFGWDIHFVWYWKITCFSSQLFVGFPANIVVFNDINIVVFNNKYCCI